jgi:hypothetical protein
MAETLVTSPEVSQYHAESSGAASGALMDRTTNISTYTETPDSSTTIYVPGTQENCPTY